MKKISEVYNRKILVDTNIPIYYSTTSFKERSGNILRTLLNNSNKIAILEITAFELLYGELKEHIRKKHLNFVNYIDRLPIEKAYLQNGTILAAEYRRVCGKKVNNIPDLIIGGTVMAYENVLLLTTDRNDFCDPLWEAVASDTILKEDGETVDANIYLLVFNHGVILPNYKK